MAIPVLLFVIALAARAGSALLFPGPAYPDSYYYVNVANALAAGGGFSVDYVWSFVDVGGVLPAEGRLPIPSNAHWMPLAALVQVPFIWVLGASPLASGLPFWLAAAAVAPLTFVVAREAGLERWQAVASGLLVALPGAVAPYLGQPDNVALFMLLGALALWLCGRSLRGDERAFALGGVVVGLAFLSRNDGLLLGIPFALVLAAGRLRPSGRRPIGRVAVLLCLGGVLLVVAPWLLRQLEVFGSVSPSAASGRILWIREYRELYSVTSETTLASFLAQGVGDIAWSRLGGLAFALFVFAGMPLLLLLAPFVLVGLWVRRSDPAFAPWVAYAVALFAFTALVSAVHVPYGTFLHSMVALVPHAYVLALVGLGSAVAAIARRRASWDVPRASRHISLMVVGVVFVGGAAATWLTSRAWVRERDSRADVLATLAAVAAPDDRVMSPDAGAYRYHGGWSGIVTPDDPLPVVEEALRRYEVRWLALEADHVTRALLPVLEGTERPAWLSEPLVQVQEVLPETREAEPGPGDRGEGGAPAGDDGAPAGDGAGAGRPIPGAALYAVCLEAGDERCEG